MNKETTSPITQGTAATVVDMASSSGATTPRRELLSPRRVDLSPSPMFSPKMYLQFQLTEPGSQLPVDASSIPAIDMSSAVNGSNNNNNNNNGNSHVSKTNFLNRSNRSIGSDGQSNASRVSLKEKYSTHIQVQKRETKQDNSMSDVYEDEDGEDEDSYVRYDHNEIDEKQLLELGLQLGEGHHQQQESQQQQPQLQQQQQQRNQPVQGEEQEDENDFGFRNDTAFPVEADFDTNATGVHADGETAVPSMESHYFTAEFPPEQQEQEQPTHPPTIERISSAVSTSDRYKGLGDASTGTSSFGAMLEDHFRESKDFVIPTSSGENRNDTRESFLSQQLSLGDTESFSDTGSQQLLGSGGRKESSTLSPPTSPGGKKPSSLQFRASASFREISSLPKHMMNKLASADLNPSSLLLRRSMSGRALKLLKEQHHDQQHLPMQDASIGDFSSALGDEHVVPLKSPTFRAPRRAPAPVADEGDAANVAGPPITRRHVRRRSDGDISVPDVIKLIDENAPRRNSIGSSSRSSLSFSAISDVDPGSQDAGSAMRQSSRNGSSQPGSEGDNNKSMFKLTKKAFDHFKDKLNSKTLTSKAKHFFAREFIESVSSIADLVDSYQEKFEDECGYVQPEETNHDGSDNDEDEDAAILRAVALLQGLEDSFNSSDNKGRGPSKQLRAPSRIAQPNGDAREYQVEEAPRRLRAPSLIAPVRTDQLQDHDGQPEQTKRLRAPSLAAPTTVAVANLLSDEADEEGGSDPDPDPGSDKGDDISGNSKIDLDGHAEPGSTDESADIFARPPGNVPPATADDSAEEEQERKVMKSTTTSSKDDKTDHSLGKRRKVLSAGDFRTMSKKEKKRTSRMTRSQPSLSYKAEKEPVGESKRAFGANASFDTKDTKRNSNSKGNGRKRRQAVDKSVNKVIDQIDPAADKAPEKVKGEKDPELDDTINSRSSHWGSTQASIQAEIDDLLHDQDMAKVLGDDSPVPFTNSTFSSSLGKLFDNESPNGNGNETAGGAIKNDKNSKKEGHQTDTTSTPSPARPKKKGILKSSSEAPVLGLSETMPTLLNNVGKNQKRNSFNFTKNKKSLERAKSWSGPKETHFPLGLLTEHPIASSTTIRRGRRPQKTNHGNNGASRSQNAGAGRKLGRSKSWTDPSYNNKKTEGTVYDAPMTEEFQKGATGEVGQKPQPPPSSRRRRRQVKDGGSQLTDNNIAKPVIPRKGQQQQQHHHPGRQRRANSNIDKTAASEARKIVEESDGTTDLHPIRSRSPRHSKVRNRRRASDPLGTSDHGSTRSHSTSLRRSLRLTSDSSQNDSLRRGSTNDLDKLGRARSRSASRRSGTVKDPIWFSENTASGIFSPKKKSTLNKSFSNSSKNSNGNDGTTNNKSKSTLPKSKSDHTMNRRMTEPKPEIDASFKKIVDMDFVLGDEGKDQKMEEREGSSVLKKTLVAIGMISKHSSRSNDKTPPAEELGASCTNMAFTMDKYEDSYQDDFMEGSEELKPVGGEHNKTNATKKKNLVSAHNDNEDEYSSRSKSSRGRQVPSRSRSFGDSSRVSGGGVDKNLDVTKSPKKQPEKSEIKQSQSMGNLQRTYSPKKNNRSRRHTTATSQATNSMSSNARSRRPSSGNLTEAVKRSPGRSNRRKSTMSSTGGTLGQPNHVRSPKKFGGGRSQGGNNNNSKSAVSRSNSMDQNAFLALAAGLQVDANADQTTTTAGREKNAKPKSSPQLMMDRSRSPMTLAAKSDSSSHNSGLHRSHSSLDPAVLKRTSSLKDMKTPPSTSSGSKRLSLYTNNTGAGRGNRQRQPSKKALSSDHDRQKRDGPSPSGGTSSQIRRTASTSSAMNHSNSNRKRSSMSRNSSFGGGGDKSKQSREFSKSSPGNNGNTGTNTTPSSSIRRSPSATFTKKASSSGNLQGQMTERSHSASSTVRRRSKAGGFNHNTPNNNSNNHNGGNSNNNRRRTSDPISKPTSRGWSNLLKQDRGDGSEEGNTKHSRGSSSTRRRKALEANRKRASLTNSNNSNTSHSNGSNTGTEGGFQKRSSSRAAA